MTKPKKIRKTVKKFLSKTPNEYGSVSWDVCADPEDTYDLIDATLRIADCNEVVTLGFSSSEKKHVKYRLQKLDNLINALQDMRKLMTSSEVMKIVDIKAEAKKDEMKALAERRQKRAQRASEMIDEED